MKRIHDVRLAVPSHGALHGHALKESQMLFGIQLSKVTINLMTICNCKPGSKGLSSDSS